MRPTWRPSSRTKIAGHRAGVTLRPILYACWSVCVCVFAHVRFCSSDYYTRNRRRDSTRGRARPRRCGRRSVVYVPRTQRSAYRLPRHRLPPGYSELAGRRRYGGLPARHTRVAVLVHRSELTRLCFQECAMERRQGSPTEDRDMERRQGSPTDRGAVGSTRSDFKLCCGPLPCVCMTSLLLRSVHRRVGLFTGGWVRPAARRRCCGKSATWGRATGSRRCGGQILCEFTLVR